MLNRLKIPPSSRLFIAVLLFFSLGSISKPQLRPYQHLAPATPLAETPVQELSKEEKWKIRSHIFTHLAGIALVPTLKAFMEHGVFTYYALNNSITVEDIAEKLKGNAGYLRVAFRLFVSYGWMRELDQNGGNKVYVFTEEGQTAMSMIAGMTDPFSKLVSFIPFATQMDDLLFNQRVKNEWSLLLFRELAESALKKWIPLDKGEPAGETAVKKRLNRQLNGILTGPVMVALAQKGVFKKLNASGGKLNLTEMSQWNLEALRLAFSLLETEGWVILDGNEVVFTPEGLFAAKTAAAYGVTVSYLPTFEKVSTLLFGDPASIQMRDEYGNELMVNRPMNVWGSGGAHDTYFKKMDDVIIEIFNRPIEQQPKGVCDMGCGNGAFLKHIYEVVRDRTLRGHMLQDHPLILIGADFNYQALEATKATLREAGIETFKTIQGNVNDPDDLAASFSKLNVSDFGMEQLNVADVLHVRSFLDHNRLYEVPEKYSPGARKHKTTTTGAFASKGREIPADELEENLVIHLERWEPYVKKFGLLVLELHTVTPEIAAVSRDRSLAVPYDATHGYSDQYLVEIDVWLRLAKEAGLKADPRYQIQFPKGKKGTVSINYFVADKPVPIEEALPVEEAI